MITLYELLKRAKKGEVLYTNLPARNVTSASARVGRRVKTAMCLVYPMSANDMGKRDPSRVLRIKVVT